MERWKPVVGYEGRYEVSDHGAVMTCLSGEAKHLRPGRASNGYMTVCLHLCGAGKTFCVHHLVAAAFLGPRPLSALVLHADGDKQNNRLDNLRYGTHADNNHDRLYQGTRKWSAREIKELKRRLLAGEAPLMLAKEYGMHHPQVYAIRNGKRYGHA